MEWKENQKNRVFLKEIMVNFTTHHRKVEILGNSVPDYFYILVAYLCVCWVKLRMHNLYFMEGRTDKLKTGERDRGGGGY